MITFQVTISAHQQEEEFNGFTIRIIFRQRSEMSLPPHQIKNSRIVFGYLWPNLCNQIKDDLIVCTLSRSSIVTGVTSSGTTTLVDPPSPPQELHEVPLPPDPLPKLRELPGMSNFNQRVETLCQREEAHNQQLRDLPLSPEERLEDFLACIRSGRDLDQVAFTEENITYQQLQRIDQLANPQFYTKASQLEDADYQPPCFQDVQSMGEEEGEVEEEEEHPLPIPDPLGTHSVIPHSEHNSQEQSSERSRELLDEHLGTIIEAMFQLPELPESD